jgi:hypothetical protein
VGIKRGADAPLFYREITNSLRLLKKIK